jgi:membrane protein
MSALARKYQAYIYCIKLAYTKFSYDNLTQMATTLTFYTLTAIVPVMAVALGIAKGFGLEQFLTEQLSIDIAGQKQIMQAIIVYAQNMLANLRVDIISSVGLMVLFFSAIKVLNNIELSFNKIWQIKITRRLGFRFARYMSLCLVSPTILIINNIVKLYAYQYLELFNINLWLPTKILTTIIVGLFITWLYIFMPNYKTTLKYATISGFFTSIVLQIMHNLFLYFQITLINYGTIYGGLAALPVLLLWLQSTWIILLFGVEVCFLLEHKVSKVWEFNTNLLSWEEKFTILTNISNIFIMKQKQELGPTNIKEISDSLNISTCCIQEFINNLVANNVLYKISSNSLYNEYILANNPKTHDLNKIFNKMIFNA